jgi:hypothetical protein
MHQKLYRAAWDRLCLFGAGVKFAKRKPVVIVDMDGTLCDLSHREHMVAGTCRPCNGTGRLHGELCIPCDGYGKSEKDWPGFLKGCLEDKPVLCVVEWVQALKETHTVCVVSGRALDWSGEASEAWLNLHQVPFDFLFMRAPNDYRQDTIVKKEILEAMLKTLPKDRYRVLY